jgi:hypothetical protein
MSLFITYLYTPWLLLLKSKYCHKGEWISKQNRKLHLHLTDIQRRLTSKSPVRAIIYAATPLSVYKMPIRLANTLHGRVFNGEGIG